MAKEKGKVVAKTEQEPAGIPDAPAKQEPTPKVLMSEDQQRLAALVDAAGKDAPKVEDVKDLFVRLEMVIPKIIRDGYPERSYRWVDTDELEKNLTMFGGYWELVNRQNHPKVDDRLFGIHGGITYRNQNVLCFTRRAITDAIEKRTIDEFDFKVKDSVENLEKTYHGKGKGTVTVERVEDPGDGYQAGELVPDTVGEDGYYDFSDTGSD